MTTGPDRRLLKVLKGEAIWPPPIWMMRQAGRYLPEYRETRKQAGGFLDLCYSPKLATEVTLQPIRRFGFDAAILFSDILVIPHALGRRLDFVEGEGPQLDPIDLDQLAGLSSVEKALGRLQPVFEALALIRASLPTETTLLGFCGAPWTLATYLIAGHGTPDQMPARLAAFRTPEKLDRLMDILVEVTIAYLVEQFRAGADAVQIFDSWAGTLDELSFERFAMEPVRRIVAGVRAVIPDAPIIGFPKGGGASLPAYIARTGVSAVGADWQVPLDYLRDHVQPLGAVQGNLDPLHLVTGGAGMDRAIDLILEKLGKGPLVFNLGHGITPSGQIDNVARMIARVRGTV